MNGHKDSLAVSAVSAVFQQVYAYLELGKLHLSIYIGISGVFGYVSATGVFQVRSIIIAFFITLLAAGAAVLNNIQDKEYDLYFVRTCHRSLPEKRVPVYHAAVLSALLILAGLAGLWVSSGRLPFLLGVSGLICYNLLYTPLKKRTFLAMVPGSLCGMIVPAIGWSAAGSNLSDPLLLSIITVFGTWQMAHFFIIIIKTRHQKRSLPGADRFANFYALFSGREIQCQTMIWTSLYALALLGFAVKAHWVFPGFYLPVVLNALSTWTLLFWIVFKKRTAILSAFFGINLSILFLMTGGIAYTLM